MRNALPTVALNGLRSLSPPSTAVDAGQQSQAARREDEPNAAVYPPSRQQARRQKRREDSGSGRLPSCGNMGDDAGGQGRHGNPRARAPCPSSASLAPVASAQHTLRDSLGYSASDPKNLILTHRLLPPVPFLLLPSLPPKSTPDTITSLNCWCRSCCALLLLPAISHRFHLVLLLLPSQSTAIDFWLQAYPLSIL